MKMSRKALGVLQEEILSFEFGVDDEPVRHLVKCSGCGAELGRKTTVLKNKGKDLKLHCKKCNKILFTGFVKQKEKEDENSMYR